MPSCAVPGCSSRSRQMWKDGRKHYFFQVGKDKEKQKKWREAIGREDLSEKHYICEKHFNPSKIITKRVFCGPDGTIYNETPYKIPRLERGAIPVRELENDVTQMNIPVQLLDHNYTVKDPLRLCMIPAQDSSSRRILQEQNREKETSTCDSIIRVEYQVTDNHQNKKSDEKTEQSDEFLWPETEKCANQNRLFSANQQNKKSEGGIAIQSDETVCPETEEFANQNRTFSANYQSKNSDGETQHFHLMICDQIFRQLKFQLRG